jgi:hypothetical protein
MSRWLRPSLDTVPHPPDGDDQGLLSNLIGLGDSVSFRVVTPGGGGGRGGWGLRRGGHQTSTQIFDDLFFTHFAYFRPTQSLLPSSPSSPLPSSRPRLLTQTQQKLNCSPLRPPGDQYGVCCKVPKKIFSLKLPRGPNGSPGGGLCPPPPPGECLNETLKHCLVITTQSHRSVFIEQKSLCWSLQS